jgi:two-component system sensor histidine kinase/response regulator
VKTQSPDRILIVDDEPDIALILKLHLEDAGYRTVCAQDGEQALAALAEEVFDLVLLDFRMPRMGGVEVLRRIRESDSDVAVIMMTAHGSENLAVECMKSGALDYFPKPFTLDDILPRVERALNYRRAVREKYQLEQEKDDFVSMLSHDLKNPITAVVGSIDIMREGRLGPVNAEQAEYLQSAIDSCNEVVAMIDNLLDIHRFEAGRMQMDTRNHNPVEIVRAVTDKFARVAEHEQIRMSLDLEDGLPLVAVDRRALTRVIANLLANAVKFTPEGGKIIVSCRRIMDCKAQRSAIPTYARVPEGFDAQRCVVRLSVKDTGTGIPTEELGNIFERFVQARGNSGRERGGAGLGLAYCKMAVEEMGGVIWAESKLGKGSEFIALLPCQDESIAG